MAPSSPDSDDFLARLDRIKHLTDELAHAQRDAAAARELAERIGLELDAARKSLRPHLNR